MKKIKFIITIIGLIILTPLYSQTYEEVVQVDSTNRNTLYERSLRWFIQNSKNSNYAIKLRDSDKGEVFAKLSFKTPIFKVKGGGNDWVSALNRTIEYKGLGNMTIQVLSKNGRYKYFIEVSEIEKIEKLNNGNYARRKKTKDIQNQEIKNYIDKFTNSIIEDIKKHMITESDFENSEW